MIRLSLMLHEAVYVPPSPSQLVSRISPASIRKFLEQKLAKKKRESRFALPITPYKEAAEDLGRYLARVGKSEKYARSMIDQNKDIFVRYANDMVPGVFGRKKVFDEREHMIAMRAHAGGGHFDEIDIIEKENAEKGEIERAEIAAEKKMLGKYRKPRKPRKPRERKFKYIPMVAERGGGLQSSRGYNTFKQALSVVKRYLKKDFHGGVMGASVTEYNLGTDEERVIRIRRTNDGDWYYENPKTSRIELVGLAGLR